MIDKLVRAIEEENLDVARSIFYDYAKEAPIVFKSFDQPWEYKQDEAAIKSTFLVPMAMAYCGTEKVEDMKQGEETVPSLLMLNQQAGTTPGRGRAGQMCGYVFKEGEPTFSCRECATDPTCVLCQECFSQSIHRNHKYRMYTSNGNGYCDCGDADAWTSDFACTTHSPDNAVNVPTTIPLHLLPRLRSITTVILEYATRILSWPKEKSFVVHLPGMKRITDNKRTYQTILFNDETHTYDSVIRALELSIHCTREQAMMLATFVDKEGCTSVATGDMTECTRALTDIKRRTQRDHSRRTERQGPLEVHVIESELISHQHLAIALLQWISEQLTVFPLIGNVVGEVLLKERVRREKTEGEDPHRWVPSSSAVRSPLYVPSVVSPGGTESTPKFSPSEWTIDQTGLNDDEWMGEAESLIDAIMQNDSSMWKQARGSWHQLVMKTLLMNMDQKMAFSRRFIAMYSHLHNGFIKDDQEHDVSIVALSVQMLTVPPIARRLISEEGALGRIFQAFLAQCETWVCTDKDLQGNALPVAHRRRLDFSKHTYPVALKRALHMIRDQIYLLTNKPTPAEWNDQLRREFLSGFTELITLLDLMQGMDEVKRQEGDHQQWEMEWETAFNIQLRLQELITLMISWANSDAAVHLEITAAVLAQMQVILDESKIPELEATGTTHAVVNVVGVRYAVPIFDVLRHPVSIHIPVFRLLAGLVTTPLPEAQRYLSPSGVATTPKEIEVKGALKKLDSNLFELQTRVLVLCAQMGANLWRRNGFSLVNQVHNYFSPLCRTEMFDQDIVALQYAAATMDDVSKLLVHIMFRYRIAAWADPLFEASQEERKEKEDISKYTVMLAEHFLTTLINVISERYRPGVGECTRADMLQREILHILATGPQTFSYIQQKLHHDPLLQRVCVNETVAKVANFKRASSNAAGKFELKSEYLDRYDSYFYHYTRQASSAAEQYQKKHRAQKERSVRACAPPVPIALCPLFAPLTRILLSPSLLTTLSVNLQRVARRSRFQSEGIFHRVLHLIGLALHEQSGRLLDFDFVAAASGDSFQLLKHLEDLSTKPEAAVHGDLLWWTIQKFKEVTAARDAEAAKRAGKTSEKMEGEQMDEGSREAADANQRTGGGGVDEFEKKKAAKAALAAKMRANAMSQMQRLQDKFTAKVEEEEEKRAEEADEASASVVAGGGTSSGARPREEERRIEDALYDEDEDCPILTETPTVFPVCIGHAKLTIDKVQVRTVTCVLCQEKEPLDTNHAKFVCAAYVQRSQLFTQHVSSAELRLDSFLVNSALVDEMETTTCSHTMHYECYVNLCEANQARERRGRQLVTASILDHENGEYLCPLCKRLSNTALPLLPAIHTIDIQGFSSNRASSEEETFESWITEMRRFVALTKPKHSRKRSHSERSLLDLGKLHGERGAKGAGGVDPLAQGSLESALSTSVPSASQMNLYLHLEGPAAAGAALAANQGRVDEEGGGVERGAEGGEIDGADVLEGLNRLMDGLPPPNEGVMDINEFLALPDPEDRDVDDEVMLLRGLAARLRAVAGDPPAPPPPPPAAAAAAAAAAAPAEGGQERVRLRGAAAAAGLWDQLQNLVPGVELLLEVEEARREMREREAQLVEEILQPRPGAEIDEEAAAEEAAIMGDEEDEEEDAAPLRLPARMGIHRRDGRGLEQAAEAMQRRMQAIPGVLTGILKGLPAAILAKLSKRVLPMGVLDSVDGVRHFTKFLMKTHVTTEETQSFSSTITVWRTTAHVLRSISAILAIENKPLFGALNTRQRDCVTCLSRLSALLSCNLAPFGELIKVMLRMLLHPSVANPHGASRPTFRTNVASSSNSSIGPSTSASTETGASSAPLSPPPVYNCRPSLKEEKDVKRGRAAAAAFAMFFSSDKKETTFNILNIDILALTMELMMCIGWTWHDGMRTAKNLSAHSKDMVADGSNDEVHVMRLGLTAFLFQVIATHIEPEDADMEGEGEGEGGVEMETRVEELWREVKGEQLRDPRALIKSLRESTIIFLRPLALLYHSLRLVPPPEALRDPSLDEFEPLCRYMGLPPSMLELISSPLVDELFAMWSPCVSPSDLKDVPKQPARARQLIPLPKDFSDLITIAARFRCPSIPLDEKSTMPTMCLLCGQLLCSQSYCCQKIVNKENIGACTMHLPGCSGGTGMFLRIRDCYIVLLTNRQRGCIRHAPYVDEFGEVDQGFRRGNPMHLNEEMYAKLRHLWLHQNISEEVVNRYELDHRNMAYDWNHF